MKTVLYPNSSPYVPLCLSQDNLYESVKVYKSVNDVECQNDYRVLEPCSVRWYENIGGV